MRFSDWKKVAPFGAALLMTACGGPASTDADLGVSEDELRRAPRLEELLDLGNAFLTTLYYDLDVDRSGGLSWEESQWLPQEFRDNFKNMKGADSPYFIAELRQYAAEEALKADRNHDGKLYKREREKLPVDLQDNVEQHAARLAMHNAFGGKTSGDPDLSDAVEIAAVPVPVVAAYAVWEGLHNNALRAAGKPEISAGGFHAVYDSRSKRFLKGYAVMAKSGESIFAFTPEGELMYYAHPAE